MNDKKLSPKNPVMDDIRQQLHTIFINLTIFNKKGI